MSPSGDERMDRSAHPFGRRGPGGCERGHGSLNFGQREYVMGKIMMTSEMSMRHSPFFPLPSSLRK
jgi:hypothetical protein